MTYQSDSSTVMMDRKGALAPLPILTTNDDWSIGMPESSIRRSSGPGNFIDLTGKRFGHLEVMQRSENSEKGATRWLCQCDCGNEKVVFAANLGRSNTTSCGCARRKISSDRSKTHGMRKSPEYRCWAGMLTRCTNPNDKSFLRYGARGITVCDRWRNSFEAFFSDVGPKPSLFHTIDRWPDCRGNYEPGNVRWATDAEQRRNKSNNVFVEIGGERLCLSDACRKFGVKRLTARSRLFDLGWTPEEAFGLRERGCP
ncbi:hypothetical protein [Phyllobacterium phragmitis]|uniref:hypothetical protein n=1 Tax=Phyllobacterium phragmitis TaxID=2670329 RepID=UPI0011B2638F|nr:hypothetical protein [Phyllobacterium phragmitis]